MKISSINSAMETGREKILFLRLKSKDKQAFIKAYDLYIDQIYRFIYFKVGSKEEAEDLTSAVFLKTWGYIQEGNLTDYKTLKSLIYKIARNLIIDHYRKTSRQEKISISAAGELDFIDEKQDIVQQMELKMEFAGLEAKLAELKDEYREALVLRFINELSIGEMADILNKPRGNVRVLIFRALEALKRIAGA
ncbi:RNA polymerase sigma factor [Patescibacteria group bacterium]|nr:RNA polymerase sigma factor [Patescibacteria group bacterium]MCG2690859.1 RNA polymerase sigma factor [Candidatus Parcubacteria bacterium]